MARILIVEDDRDLNNAYSIILKNEGHEVIVAFDGQEALAKIKEFSPDLILLDLLMPIMGGLEFLQHYDLLKTHADVKVLILQIWRTHRKLTKPTNWALTGAS